MGREIVSSDFTPLTSTIRYHLHTQINVRSNFVYEYTRTNIRNFNVHTHILTSSTHTHIRKTHLHTFKSILQLHTHTYKHNKDTHMKTRNQIIPLKL